MLTNTNPAIAGGSASGVSPEETPEKGGVAQTPSQPTADDAAKWQAQFDELQAQMEETRAKAEADLRGLRSSLQSRESEIRRQWETEREQWQQREFELATKGMSDEERRAAELDLLSQRLVQAESQRQAMAQELATARQIPNYLAAFGQMGVDVTKLPMEDPVELVNQGWAQLVSINQERAQKISELEAQIKAGGTTSAQSTPGGSPAASQGGVQAPAVATQTAGGPASGRSWDEVLRAVTAQVGRSVTREDVYQLVEGGHLSPTIIPGLEGLPQG